MTTPPPEFTDADQFDSAAERLYALLDAAGDQANRSAQHPQGPNEAAHTFLARWLSATEVPVDDRAVRAALSSIGELPYQARQLVADTLGDSAQINRRFVEPWFEGSVKAVAKLINPGTNVSGAVHPADAGVRGALYVTIGVLESRTSHQQPKASPGDLATWRSTLISVREDMLTSDNLSPDARRAFISVVDRLIRAIDLYRVDGADGLQEAIDMAAGTLRRQSDFHPPADRKERWWGKLLLVLGTVSVFCANANDVADFGKNVLEVGTSIYDIIDMNTPAQLPPGACIDTEDGQP